MPAPTGSVAGSRPCMTLAFEFSPAQADKPIRLLHVFRSEVVPVETARMRAQKTGDGQRFRVSH